MQRKIISLFLSKESLKELAAELDKLCWDYAKARGKKTKTDLTGIEKIISEKLTLYIKIILENNTCFLATYGEKLYEILSPYAHFDNEFIINIVDTIFTELGYHYKFIRGDSESGSAFKINKIGAGHYETIWVED